ncbi:MAG: hypothetical protein NZ602_10135 [Thermoguttaceae bacterium]|nr:hypothetical protein [Thermoguttaceae bacterium]MDW8036852.1 hypothetical protein [Thermoguttaceae bacterium]
MENSVSGNQKAGSDFPTPLQQAEDGGSSGTDSGPSSSRPFSGQPESRADYPQVVLPDKRWQRWVLLVAVLTLLGAGVTLTKLASWIFSLDQLEAEQFRQSVAHLKQLVALIACLGAVGFLGAAGWVFRLAWKITRTGQYPPPGMRVLWKSKIHTGPAALLRANFAYLLAVILVAGGSLGMLWLYQQANQSLHQLLTGR